MSNKENYEEDISEDKDQLTPLISVHRDRVGSPPSHLPPKTRERQQAGGSEGAGGPTPPSRSVTPDDGQGPTSIKQSLSSRNTPSDQETRVLSSSPPPHHCPDDKDDHSSPLAVRPLPSPSSQHLHHFHKPEDDGHNDDVLDIRSILSPSSQHPHYSDKPGGESKDDNVLDAHSILSPSSQHPHYSYKPRAFAKPTAHSSSYYRTSSLPEPGNIYRFAVGDISVPAPGVNTVISPYKFDDPPDHIAQFPTKSHSNLHDFMVGLFTLDQPLTFWRVADQKLSPFLSDAINKNGALTTLVATNPSLVVPFLLWMTATPVVNMYEAKYKRDRQKDNENTEKLIKKLFAEFQKEIAHNGEALLHELCERIEQHFETIRQSNRDLDEAYQRIRINYFKITTGQYRLYLSLEERAAKTSKHTHKSIDYISDYKELNSSYSGGIGKKIISWLADTAAWGEKKAISHVKPQLKKLWYSIVLFWFFWMCGAVIMGDAFSLVLGATTVITWGYGAGLFFCIIASLAIPAIVFGRDDAYQLELAYKFGNRIYRSKEFSAYPVKPKYHSSYILTANELFYVNDKGEVATVSRRHDSRTHLHDPRRKEDPFDTLTREINKRVKQNSSDYFSGPELEALFKKYNLQLQPGAPSWYARLITGKPYANTDDSILKKIFNGFVWFGRPFKNTAGAPLKKFINLCTQFIMGIIFLNPLALLIAYGFYRRYGRENKDYEPRDNASKHAVEVLQKSITLRQHERIAQAKTSSTSDLFRHTDGELEGTKKEAIPLPTLQAPSWYHGVVWREVITEFMSTLAKIAFGLWALMALVAYSQPYWSTIQGSGSFNFINFLSNNPILGYFSIGISLAYALYSAFIWYRKQIKIAQDFNESANASSMQELAAEESKLHSELQELELEEIALKKRLGLPDSLKKEEPALIRFFSDPKISLLFFGCAALACTLFNGRHIFFKDTDVATTLLQYIPNLIFSAMGLGEINQFAKLVIVGLIVGYALLHAFLMYMRNEDTKKQGNIITQRNTLEWRVACLRKQIEAKKSDNATLRQQQDTHPAALRSGQKNDVHIRKALRHRTTQTHTGYLPLDDDTADEKAADLPETDLSALYPSPRGLNKTAKKEWRHNIVYGLAGLALVLALGFLAVAFIMPSFSTILKLSTIAIYSKTILTAAFCTIAAAMIALIRHFAYESYYRDVLSPAERNKTIALLLGVATAAVALGMVYGLSPNVLMALIGGVLAIAGGLAVACISRDQKAKNTQEQYSGLITIALSLIPLAFLFIINAATMSHTLFPVLAAVPVFLFAAYFFNTTIQGKMNRMVRGEYELQLQSRDEEVLTLIDRNILQNTELTLEEEQRMEYFLDDLMSAINPNDRGQELDGTQWDNKSRSFAPYTTGAMRRFSDFKYLQRILTRVQNKEGISKTDWQRIKDTVNRLATCPLKAPPASDAFPTLPTQVHPDQYTEVHVWCVAFAMLAVMVGAFLPVALGFTGSQVIPIIISLLVAFKLITLMKDESQEPENADHTPQYALLKKSLFLISAAASFLIPVFLLTGIFTFVWWKLALVTIPFLVSILLLPTKELKSFRATISRLLSPRIVTGVILIGLIFSALPIAITILLPLIKAGVYAPYIKAMIVLASLGVMQLSFLGVKAIANTSPTVDKFFKQGAGKHLLSFSKFLLSGSSLIVFSAVGLALPTLSVLIAFQVNFSSLGTFYASTLASPAASIAVLASGIVFTLIIFRTLLPKICVSLFTDESMTPDERARKKDQITQVFKRIVTVLSGIFLVGASIAALNFGAPWTFPVVAAAWFVGTLVGCVQPTAGTQTYDDNKKRGAVITANTASKHALGFTRLKPTPAPANKQHTSTISSSSNNSSFLRRNNGKVDSASFILQRSGGTAEVPVKPQLAPRTASNNGYSSQ